MHMLCGMRMISLSACGNQRAMGKPKVHFATDAEINENAHTAYKLNARERCRRGRRRV